jgi:hypothetical protein
MTHENYGWLFSLVHVDGPNVVELVDTGQPDPVDPLVNIFNEVPVNIAKLNVVEIARLWRLERNYFGGFCEVMLGVRYSQFTSSAGDVVLGPFIVTFVDINGVVQTETVFLDIGQLQVENNMLGGEIGLRWFKQKGRWLLNADTKFIPSANFQFHRGNVRDPQTGLPPLDPSRDEFVPIGEIRLGATYELTRDVSIGSDFTLMYFGQGIARGFENPEVGPPDLFNDESLVIAGFSLRLTVNR